MGPTTSTAEGERSTKQMGLNQEGVETERKHSSRHVFLRNLSILDFFCFCCINRTLRSIPWMQCVTYPSDLTHYTVIYQERYLMVESEI